MLPTHAAFAETHLAARVYLGAELRLATVSAVITEIDRILPSRPARIELDATRLSLMTEGARRVLLVATDRLAARDVDLVVVGCDPFDV